MRISIPSRQIGVWLRPVERTVRVREVPSSNLGTPTEQDSRQGVLFILFPNFQIICPKIVPQSSLSKNNLAKYQRKQTISCITERCE